jgi:hypothetical protein
MRISVLNQAGLDRLHHAMTARVENGSLPGIVTVAQGDERANPAALMVGLLKSNLLVIPLVCPDWFRH